MFAIMENCRPTELDPNDLSVLGERDFDGVLGTSFSAHPHRVDSLATSFNFGIRYGKQTFLDLYALPDAGGARRLGEIACPWAGLVHDFVVTENYALFLICPGKLTVLKALLKIGDLADWFEWHPQEGCELVIAPLSDLSAARRVRIDAFWVWHFANAFERAGEIVVDYCRYPNLDSLGAISGKTEAAPPTLYRAVVDPKTCAWRSEQLWSQNCEFPRVLPAQESRDHRHIWLLTSSDDRRDGIARIDIDLDGSEISAHQWEPPAHVRPSEPIPVARGRKNASDASDAWVLTLCHDDQVDASFLAVLDGAELSRGPVAKLWFDHTIPTTFHGHWSPS